MKTRKPSTPVLVYQMKVTLLGIEPPIWRRFLVISDQTLYRLHMLLQCVMGWENYHLHEFTIDGIDYGEPDEEYEPDIENACKYRLNQVLHKEGQIFYYTYDYGDNWEHEIQIEEIFPEKPSEYYPACIDGERACPPEDCGGVTGYMDILEIIKDPEHEEYEHIISWLGDGFDPERFYLRGINKELVRHSHEWQEN